jgi:hypothetical protein
MTFYYSLEELGGSCPANSSNFPVCTCNTGYSGNLVFDEVTMTWMGSCVESTNVEEPADNENNNSTESNNTTPLDEENEVPGFGFITVLISLLAISFFRRRE